ncbi:MAG: hypothetical protein AAGG99_05025, partial [Pseudomonadota bacterium]
MQKAYRLAVDVNAGIGMKRFEPKFDSYWLLLIDHSAISEADLSNVPDDLSIVIPKLVRGRYPEV